MAVKLIIGENKLYSESLKELKITTLKERRTYLSVKFARKCLTSKNTSDIFKENTRKHKIKLRTREHFQVNHTRTVRL